MVPGPGPGALLSADCSGCSAAPLRHGIPGRGRSHGTSLPEQVLARVPSRSSQLWKELVSSCDTTNLSPASLILFPHMPALHSKAL